METASPQPKKKRKRQEDEIDALFNASLGKKVKKAALTGEGALVPGTDNKTDGKPGVGGVVDKGLQDVLGAIKAAPKGEKIKPKRRKN